ncbi:DUF84 family protein [Salipaludibacillus sp. CUR1]|uniref:DUF84 family protein n=1 Tax=Salipaludibacillus sp. CUR1 TaxID=2820003 RepID=UPI001E5A888B|nr:DUF84 family protein [Salipaludibacillus sp. CUR1]MCE7791429.1 DUF84 family protein [Salipaludibacillus sp. CUR1]
MKKGLYVGSENPAKIASVKEVFGKDFEIRGVSAPSGVSSQPASDEETMQGAVNRATYLIAKTNGKLALGLEGGIMTLNKGLYLCNWGALATEQGGLYLAGGARVPLPESVVKLLQDGLELGEVMDIYTKQQDTRNKEGAIGVLTNGHITRSQMFVHINFMLKGQYEKSLTY